MLSRTGSTAARLLVGLVVSVLLTGCTVASLVGANSEPPPVTHDLRAAAHHGLGYQPLQLTVNEPAAVEALSGSRIAIKPGPSEISYFAASVWTDKLPRLLQMRLVETMEKSRIVKAVSTGNDRIRGDIGMATTIRDFQVEVNGALVQARIGLFVRLIDEDRGQLVASREFSAVVRAQNDSVGAGVYALGEAFSAISLKIMRWIVNRRIIIAEADQ